MILLFRLLYLEDVIQNTDFSRCLSLLTCYGLHIARTQPGEQGADRNTHAPNAVRKNHQRAQEAHFNAAESTQEYDIQRILQETRTRAREHWRDVTLRFHWWSGRSGVKLGDKPTCMHHPQNHINHCALRFSLFLAGCVGLCIYVRRAFGILSHWTRFATVVVLIGSN